MSRSTPALRAVFVAYALARVASLALYAGSRRAGARAAARAPRPLARSRGIVLAAHRALRLDSFGGGFAVQSLLALWLFQRFDLSLAEARAFFFAAALLAALSQLVSPRLAARFGLIETMVFTHIPANAVPDAPRRSCRAPRSRSRFLLAAHRRSRRWTCPRASRT